MSENFVVDLIKAKPESAPSLKPPKEWFDKKYQEVKQGNPDYSDAQARATVGDIWHNKMSVSQKKTRREKEGKTYGKVKKSMSTETYFLKSNSKMADDHDRDGENVGNEGQKDYFGKRDVAKKNPKKKEKKFAKPLNKALDYFGIYINKTKPHGGEHHATHLDGLESQPIKVNPEQVERDIEVRPAEQANNRLANQDAFDQATQGEMVKLQMADESIVTYLSVQGKVDRNLIGYEGSTPERAEFYSSQGDQSRLKSVPVVGETKWTAELIPRKKLSKANPTICTLFATAPDDPDMAKSVAQDNLVNNNMGAIRAKIPNRDDQKYYDVANAFISVLHKSYHPRDIFPILTEKAKTNQLLAKAIKVCDVDESYVIGQATNLYKESNTTGATNYAVQKALSHFA